jgi:hypothetical protein
MKIAITDDRFGWNDEELRVFGDFSVPGLGRAELITADCRTEQDLITACSGADAVLLNQAPMAAREVLEGRIPRTPVNRPLNVRESYPGGEISRTEVTA